MNTSLKALLLERIEVDLEAKGLTPQRTVIQRALGASFAGEIIQPAKFFVAMSREISDLGTVIFEAIQNVVSSVEIQIDGHLVGDVLQVFDLGFDPVLNSMVAGFGPKNAQVQGHDSASERLRQHGESTRRRRKLDVRLTLEKIMQDKSRHSGFTLQNYGQIGMVQQGQTNSVGSSTVNLGAAEKESFREILRSISERLDGLELPQADKDELREVAQDAGAELEKAKPNGRKLTALISIFAHRQGHQRAR